MSKQLLLCVFSMSTALSSTAFAAIDGDSEGGGEPTTGGGGGGEPAPTIVKYFSYAPSWGSDDWGAGLYAGGSLTATPAASLSERDKAAASATLNATARINGSRYRIVNIRGNANVENGRSAQVTLSAGIGSADFWTYTQSTTLPGNVVTLITPSWDKVMFDQRVGIWVGPVPVTFSAKVTGQLGAGLDASLNVTRFGVTFTPTAGASLYASAAIGGEVCIGPLCAGASAGVYTDINLFSVRLPTRVEAALTPVQNGVTIGMVLRSDVTVSSLDGELGAFAEAHVGDLDYRWSTSLLTWSGLSSSAQLFSYSGTSCLVGSCLTTISVTPRK